MALDDVVKESIREAGRGLAYHGCSALREAGRTLVASAMFPTIVRRRRNERRRNGQWPAFLEEVVTLSAGSSTAAVNVALALGAPVYGIGLLCTNAGSLLYEGWRAYHQKAIIEGGEQNQQGSPNERRNAMSILASLHSSISSFVSSIKAAPKKITASALHLLRHAGVYLSSYALVGMLAAGHYGITDSFHQQKTTTIQEVNVDVHECSIQLSRKQHLFYVLGEIHVYNRSSSVFVARLMKKKKVDVLLIEGYGEESQQQSSSTTPARPLSEYLLHMAYIPLVYGSGFREPDAYAWSKALGIEVVGLEHQDASGLREGLGEGGHAYLGILSAGIIATAPYLYVALAASNHLGAPLASSPVLKHMAQTPLYAPLIDERNGTMVRNAVSFLEQHPNKTALVNVGSGHVPGMLQLFETYGPLKCTDVDKVGVLYSP